MSKRIFIIQDWAGNHLFRNKTFKTFEDGWEFIYENVDNSAYDLSGNDNDNEYQEYFVIEATN